MYIFAIHWYMFFHMRNIYAQPENYWIFIGSESTRGVVSRPARISPWRDNFSELINIQFIIVLSQFDNNALDGV